MRYLLLVIWTGLIMGTLFLGLGCTPSLENPQDLPSVRILEPTDNQIFSQSLVLVRGRAESPDGLSQVFLSINDGEFIPLGNSPDWQTNLNLADDIYQFRVYALDMSNRAGLLATVTNIRVSAHQTLYVATNGNDENSGLSPDKALREMSEAISRFERWGYSSIRVGAGIFPLPDGLTINRGQLDIRGGYDAHFAFQSSETILDGSFSQASLIQIVHATNVFLHKLTIYHGGITNTTNLSSTGGGVYISNSADITLSDCRIISNYAGSLGGGVVAYYSSGVTLESVFIGNKARLSAGALFLKNNHSTRIINSMMTNNASTLTPAVVYLMGENALIITNCLIGGVSADYGVYEDGDIQNHTLAHNRFLTNTLSHLYYDDINGIINDIEYLNDAPYIGASLAIGNTAVTD